MKNVKINGTTYSGVDTVKLQVAEGSGYVEFIDTSDATGTAADVAAGKIVYANGEKLVGTKVDSGGEDVKLQNKTVDPKTTKQTVTADSGYTGLSGVTVNAVTSSIDSNIQASNIKKGVTILNVTGTLEQSVSGGGETVVTDFPFPHNNIQTGSFTPSVDEEAHSITCDFAPRAVFCVLADLDTPLTGGTQYSGICWLYLENSFGGGFSAMRSGGDKKAPLNATSNNSVKEGNTVTFSANVVNASQKFIAGRTYNWVAWDY
jgi:hypothetical protein